MFSGLGWGYWSKAIALLTPLDAGSAEYFAMHSGSLRPESDELYAEGLRILDAVFSRLAAEVYTPPPRDGTHVDQLESIIVDTNEVIHLAIYKWGNQSAFLRVLLERLHAQLRQTLGTGSQITEAAEAAVRSVIRYVGDITIKLNQSALGVPESGALLIEATDLYGELGKSQKLVTGEFRIMREDEKKAGRGGDTFNIAGNVNQLVKGDNNTNTVNQTAGASLAEVAALLRELREQVQSLPPQSRQDAIDCIEAVEVEVKAEKPSPGKIRGFLAGIREAAEAGGATAETVDKIVSLTQKVGPLLLPLASAVLGGG